LLHDFAKMACRKQWVLPLQFLLIGLVSLVGTGCTSDGCTQNTTKGPPADSLAPVQSELQAGNTNIVIDATPSMSGFTSSSRYQNLITLDFANASLEGTKLTYYRLTTALPGGIQEAENKMQAAQPAFYASGNTDLQTALDSLASDGLTVIVTDLFQSSADMNAVSQSIIRQVLDKDMALGIIGVRLPFDGRVYDLGPDARSFPYEGKRPVYGLVSGAPRAVSDYLENFKRYVDTEEYKFVLFSPRVAERSARADVRSTDVTRNLVQVVPKARTPLPGERTFGLRIRDNAKPAQLGAKFSMKVLPGAHPLLDPSAIDARVTGVWKCDDGEDGYVQNFKGHSTARKAFRARVVPGDSTDILRLEASPKDLRRGRYVFNFVTEVPEWDMPEWVSNWTLPPSQFGAGTPDGSKTANLRPFLLDIGSSLTAGENPRVGTFQAYVEKQ
jgi:hypothetical protein